MNDCSNETLSPAEQTSWEENKVTISQCVDAGMAFNLAMLDIKERRLYRAEYQSWDDFLKRFPAFRDKSRQRKHQIKKALACAEEMSTAVDVSDLKEWELRHLMEIPSAVDRAEIKRRLRADDLAVNEANVNRFHLALLAEKEEKERERAAMPQLSAVSETDVLADAPAEEEDAEPVAEQTLARAARKVEKRPEYFGRFLEYARLAVKNSRKVTDADLETPESRSALLQLLDAWDESVSRLRLLARGKEA